MLKSVIRNITGVFGHARTNPTAAQIEQPAEPSKVQSEQSIAPDSKQHVADEHMPAELIAVHAVIEKSVAISQEMVANMFAVAQESGGLSPVHSERLLELSYCGEGAEADATALAQALVYSQSPLTELHHSLHKQSVLRQGSIQATSLVVQAALSEQQFANRTLRQGTQFNAAKLYETLLEWVYKGAHRPGLEDAPLTKIAKTIDVSSKGAKNACEMRFGCVIPVLVSVQILGRLQDSEVQNKPQEVVAPGC